MDALENGRMCVRATGCARLLSARIKNGINEIKANSITNEKKILNNLKGHVLT